MADNGEIEKAHAARKGRGSSRHLAGRFEVTTSSHEDDGWQSVYEYLADQPDPRTQVTSETARSIITRNNSPDIGFSQSINPYRGCEHGCFYCFARPSHSYLGLSPGLDFETKLYAKINALEQLERDLSKPSYSPSPIALGINTDGYQPIERTQLLTQRLLQRLAELKHPVTIVTKSALILRDIEILRDMAADNLVHVHLSITTLDNRLSAKMEPRAAAPHARLRTIESLSQAGIPTGVMVAPVIPAITDAELETILEKARTAGARGAGYVLLRLPHELRDLSRDWFEQHTPGKAQHVLSLLNQMRGGRDYDSAFGTRMTGTGVFADLIEQRFKKARKRLGFERLPELNSTLFKPPSGPQGALF